MGSSVVSVGNQIQSVNARPKERMRQRNEDAKILIPLLAKRAYHLPRNNWCQDWIQYMRNNHPFFGICCHYRMHPLGMGQRVIILIGSIAFGLAITNVVALYFAFDRDDNYDDIVFSFEFGNATSIPEEYRHVEVTTGMMILWTFGSGVHSFFDLLIWSISTCSCCHPGGHLHCLGCMKNFGSYFVVGLVMVIVAFATFLVVWRAAQESHEQYLEEKERLGYGNDDTYPSWEEVRSVASFEFLVSYAVEVALALFVYYPFLGTVIFSGILGCGRLPFLGGRPLSVRNYKLRLEKERESASSQSLEGSGKKSRLGLRRTSTSTTLSSDNAFEHYP